ncbi:MAG: response regulator transcription factor [Geobacteraceae bacterium]|nr:response regulator transcription factor [Geobacteraceae bacterium]
MGKILIIDDDASFLVLLSRYIEQYFPLLEVQTCTNPLQGLRAMNKDLDLMIIDLEMPHLDGSKLLKYAAETGISKNRIILLSSHDADYLHDHFPMGTCLAVLNKFEAGQKAVLDMIFSSLEKKASR